MVAMTGIVMAYDELKTARGTLMRRALEAVEAEMSVRRRGFDQQVFEAHRAGATISGMATAAGCSRNTIYDAIKRHKEAHAGIGTGRIYFEKESSHGWAYTFVCKEYDFSHLGGGIVPLSGTMTQIRDAKPGEPQWKASANEFELRELMSNDLRTEGSVLKSEWEAFKEREGLK